MARPNKQGLDYFPFDIDFFDDEKIEAISGEFGIKGEITAIKLLCAIYRNGYFILWNEMLKMKLLHNLPGVSPDLLDQIISRLVKWGFFEKSLFDSDRILTSRGIQERYFSAIKRRKNDEKPPYLLVNVCNNPSGKELMHTKTTQRKEKENKEEISPYGDTKKGVPAGTALSPAYSKDLLEKEIPACKTELLGDTYWLEVLCMNNHLSIAQLTKLIDSFFAILQNRGETTKSTRDAKHHFASWLQIELNQKGGKNAGNTTGMDGVKVQPASYGER